jgi:hypothetical protein
VDSRHPTRILYVRYSSRSWGASLLRGSCWRLELDGRGGNVVVRTHEFNGDLGVVQ